MAGTWALNLPHDLGLATVVFQLTVTVAMFTMARAPGWSELRAFGWVALTGAAYSAVYAVATVRPTGPVEA